MKTITNQTLLIDKHIENLASQHGLIAPFDPSLLSGCTYDLRVGAILKSRNRSSTFDLNTSEYIVESGECFTIETLEEINFRSFALFGTIANKHSLLAKGLFHPVTNIDPGFKGRLAITFIHMGNTRHKINKGDKICKLSFLSINSIPQRVYGVSQNPSYREGSTDIALIVDKPESIDSEKHLSRMYGEPVSHLYNRLDEVEERIEYSLLKAENARWRDRKSLVIGALLALLSGLSGSLLTIYWPKIQSY